MIRDITIHLTRIKLVGTDVWYRSDSGFTIWIPLALFNWEPPEDILIGIGGDDAPIKDD